MADQNQQKLTDQINSLDDRISKLENYKNKQSAQQLQLPLDVASQQIMGTAISNFLINNLQDLMWRKVFSWTSLFESIDGYTQTGTVTISGSQILMTTGATSGNSSSIQKLPGVQNLLDFSKRIFMRASFTPAVANATVYLVVGQAINATGDQYFGFKVVNGTLFAVVSVNGTGSEVTAQIATGLSGEINVEARYFPNAGKITFFYNQTPTNSDPVRVFSSPTVSLPTGLFQSLYHAYVKTTANSAQTLAVSFFEFMQQLNIVK